MQPQLKCSTGKYQNKIIIKVFKWEWSNADFTENLILKVHNVAVELFQLKVHKLYSSIGNNTICIIIEVIQITHNTMCSRTTVSVSGSGEVQVGQVRGHCPWDQAYRSTLGAIKPSTDFLQVVKRREKREGGGWCGWICSKLTGRVNKYIWADFVEGGSRIAKHKAVAEILQRKDERLHCNWHNEALMQNIHSGLIRSWISKENIQSEKWWIKM